MWDLADLATLIWSNVYWKNGLAATFESVLFVFYLGWTSPVNHPSISKLHCWGGANGLDSQDND